MAHLFISGHPAARACAACQRRAEARTLLRDTDLPLARIAELCGFCIAYYLSNRFRQTMGLSPREWRKERI